MITVRSVSSGALSDLYMPGHVPVLKHMLAFVQAQYAHIESALQVGVVGSGQGMTDYKKVARHDFNPDAE